MNIQLSGAEEFENGKSNGVLGQVLIRCVVYKKQRQQELSWGPIGEILTDRRCNNVLWISAKNQNKANGDANMEG